jgi:hypothetical protein
MPTEGNYLKTLHQGRVNKNEYCGQQYINYDQFFNKFNEADAAGRILNKIMADAVHVEKLYIS